MAQNVNYKQLVDEWLESEDKDIEAGALLLLKLNRNRVLYQYITRKKALPKLIYEMKKQSDILSKRQNLAASELTDEEVQKFTQKSERAAKTIEIVEKGVKGKRHDHEQLSQEAQEAYEKNLNIYPKMRSLHEKLKLMVNDRPCDRYPFLKELVGYDEQIRSNWKLYDNAKVLPAQTEQKDEILTQDNTDSKTPVLDANGVSAARRYLSGNKKRLASLKETDKDKYDLLLVEMQKRYDDLIFSGQSINEKQIAELKEAGLSVKE